MQAVQIISYPIQFIVMKCRACIQWLLGAWQGMFNRRPVNMGNHGPTAGAQRPMPRSQRTRLNRNRSEPINLDDLPKGVPLKCRIIPPKVVRKNYYRPAVIPLKWHGRATNNNVDNLVKPEETEPKVIEQALQVLQNEIAAKSPNNESRKKWQIPAGQRYGTYSAIRDDGKIKSGAKLAPQETKHTPFVNKRWSY